MERPTTPPPAHLRASQPQRLAPLTTLDAPTQAANMERERSSSSSTSILSGPFSYKEDGGKAPADSTTSTSISFAALPVIETSASTTPAAHPGEEGVELADDADLEAFASSAAASRRGSAASGISSRSNNYNATLGPNWIESHNNKGLSAVTPARTPLIEGLEEGTDPLDWSNKFKCWAFFVYCLMVLSATYGSASFSASAKTIEEHFGVGRLVAASGTSLWVLGFAIGPLVFGPASEVAGRKPVYLFAFAFLIAAQLIAALANSITLLLIMRFLGGVFGSAPLNNCASSISDMTRLRNRMRYNSLYRCATIGGATLGPLIGTFINGVSWRLNLGVLPILSAISITLYALTIPESHRNTIERRQIKARYEAAATLLNLEAAEKGAVPSKVEERMLAGPSTLQRYKLALKMPFVMLFQETLVQIVCAYTAMLYGLMYALLAASSLVWQDIRGRSAEYAALTYLALFLGIVAGVGIMGFWIQDREFKKAYDADTCTPETRIGLSRWASLLVPVGLFLFGWTAPYDILVGTADVHYVIPCIALAIFAFGLQSVFNSWLSYLTDAYGSRAASAMSAATFTRSLLGAAFPLFFRQLLIAISIQATFSIFAGLSLLLSLAGFWFHRNGAAIRARSRYAEGSE